MGLPRLNSKLLSKKPLPVKRDLPQLPPLSSQLLSQLLSHTLDSDTPVLMDSDTLDTHMLLDSHTPLDSDMLDTHTLPPQLLPLPMLLPQLLPLPTLLPQLPLLFHLPQLPARLSRPSSRTTQDSLNLTSSTKLFRLGTILKM